MMQVRNYRFRGALFLINLLLLAYLGFLLLNLYRSHDRIQGAVLEQQQHVTEKRAVALESYLLDRSEDMIDLSEKQQLLAYFENLSLGMSLEYGLGASLDELQRAFDRYRSRKKLDGGTLYSRIMFVTADGKVLVDSHDGSSRPLDRKLLSGYRSARTSGVRQYIAPARSSSEPAQLVLACPFRFKDQFAGHILAWIPFNELYNHFIGSVSSKNDLRNSLGVLHDRKQFLASPAATDSYRIRSSMLPAATALKPGQQTFQFSSPDSGTSFSAVAVTVPVLQSRLFITMFAPLDLELQVSPRQLVVTTAAIGLLILVGAVVLIRSDTSSRLAAARLEEARLREEAIAEQNRLLTITAAELKESRERLSLALEGAELGLWDWHLPSGSVSYNEQWAAMLGYRLDELEPSVSVWESLVHPDDMPLVQQVLQHHLEGLSSFYETEHRCRTKDGRWYWILDRGRVVERDAAGNPIRMAGTHLDINDRKLAEERLLLLNEELEQRVQEELAKNREKDAFMLQQDKMASIGQLAAGVAHEINNPMGFIISNLGTLREYTGSMKNFIAECDTLLAGKNELKQQFDALYARHDLHFITNDIGDLLQESLEGADRVKHIVLDLKDFARVDDATVKATDLNQCVNSTVNIVRNELKYVAQLNLELGAIPKVMCNPQQINQVITNLLVNAAQAIEGHGSLTVTTLFDAGSVVLKVADTGKGMSPETVKRIFEPFFTTKPVGQGTGLGLTISYDMVRKNGGEISVESEPGKGTTFTVRLPAQTSEEDA